MTPHNMKCILDVTQFQNISSDFTILKLSHSISCCKFLSTLSVKTTFKLLNILQHSHVNQLPCRYVVQ